MTDVSMFKNCIKLRSLSVSLHRPGNPVGFAFYNDASLNEADVAADTFVEFDLDGERIRVSPGMAVAIATTLKEMIEGGAIERADHVCFVSHAVSSPSFSAPVFPIDRLSFGDAS